ncbi:MAG: pyridoxamine 5'-phosphate oxidase family protein [Dehalococcoidia bacterium]
MTETQDPRAAARRRSVPTPALPATDEIKQAVRAFVDERGQAAFYTLDRDGFPTGRVLGVSVGDDWTVEIVQARRTGRVAHVRRTPQVAVVWTEGTNGRNVYLRGSARLVEGDELIAAYGRRMAANRARGSTMPAMPDDEVRELLIGIAITPRSIRTEHFGEGMGIYEWRP